MIRIITGMCHILVCSWTSPKISKYLSPLLFIDSTIKNARSLLVYGWLHVLPDIHIHQSYNYTRITLALCLPFHSFPLRHMEPQPQLQQDTCFFPVPRGLVRKWEWPSCLSSVLLWDHSYQLISLHISSIPTKKLYLFLTA